MYKLPNYTIIFYNSLLILAAIAPKTLKSEGYTAFKLIR